MQLGSEQTLDAVGRRWRSLEDRNTSDVQVRDPVLEVEEFRIENCESVHASRASSTTS